MVQQMSDFFEIYIFLLFKNENILYWHPQVRPKCDTQTTLVRTGVLEQCCPGLVFKEKFKSWFLPTCNLLLEPKRNLHAQGKNNLTYRNITSVFQKKIVIFSTNKLGTYLIFFLVKFQLFFLFQTPKFKNPFI